MHLSPDLYNFIEEFAVVSTCQKAEVPRENITQFADDIVCMGMSKEEVERLTSTLRHESSVLDFIFNEEKIESLETLEREENKEIPVKESFKYLGTI